MFTHRREGSTTKVDPYIHRINDTARRDFAGMVSAVDEGIGNVTKALEESGCFFTRFKKGWKVYMGVSKNNGTPQIINFNRVFQYFHHPFWGTPIFGNIQ